MNKKISMVLILLLMIIMMAACAKKSNLPPSSSGTAKTTIDFWAAPNPPQQAYWTALAKEYEEVNTNVLLRQSFYYP